MQVRIIWELWNKTSRMMFSTKELAEQFMIDQKYPLTTGLRIDPVTMFVPEEDNEHPQTFTTEKE